MYRKIIHLPYPKLIGVLTLEEAIILRRSIRDFVRGASISIEMLSQLLWSAQGISEPYHGFRTCPSAGATYPLNIYAVVPAGGVRELEPGVYKYIVETHSIALVRSGDYRSHMYHACLDQKWVYDASVNIIITAVFERTCTYYGTRGVQYVMFEAGHACQNIYLQATGMGLGAVAIGAFYDDEIKEIACTEPTEKPLYVVAIGVPRTRIADKTRAIEILKKVITYYEKNRR